MNKRIYLCSRVREDARPLNDRVAAELRRAGFTVFVPHEAPHNNTTGATDKEIFSQDMNAMMMSDICVAVGRLGTDCSFEIGHFQAREIPTFWLTPKDTKFDRQPMFHEVPKYAELQELVEDVCAYALVSDWGAVTE